MKKLCLGIKAEGIGGMCFGKCKCCMWNSMCDVKLVNTNSLHGLLIHEGSGTESKHWVFADEITEQPQPD